MQLTRIFGTVFSLCLLTASAQESSRKPQNVPGKTVTITLQEAIQMALEHNLDVQIQRFNPAIAQYSLSLSYATYDPTFYASGRHDYTLSTGGIDAQNREFQGAVTDTDSFQTGIGGSLPYGLSYNLSGSIQDSYGDRPGLIPPARTIFENASGRIGAFELRQNLLKDFWIDPARANIQAARNRLKYSDHVFRYLVMQTISQVEQAYYNLIFARENVKVQEKALELVERSLVETRKKVEVGALAQLEEKQAESLVATSKADLLSAKRSLALQENALKGLLTDSFSSLHDTSYVPGENLVAIPAIFNLQESWRKGVSQRPDLQQAKLDVERSEINERLDRNQMLPTLDLLGQFGYAGSGNEYSDALGDISRRSNPFHYFGAEIRYPLGNRAARNNYKISKAQKEQMRLQLKKKEQDIIIEIDDAIKQAQTNLERVEATRQARLFAEAALDAEQKKLENGKSTPFFVLQFQRNLTAARFEEIRALAEYNNALALLAFREGATLERHKITLTVK